MSLIRIIILLLIAVNVQAQSCPKYDAALKKGDEAARTQNYHAALKAYQDAQIAARDCDVPSNKAAAGIENVFKEIETQRDQAIKAKNEAVKAKNEALRSKEEADSAKSQSAEAEAYAKAAELSKLRAFSQKSEAERSRMLAEAKTEAHKSIMFFNARDTKQGTDYALKAYEHNMNNAGPVQDNDIYTALLLSWEQTNKDKQPSISAESVISMTGVRDSNIIYSANNKGELEIWQYEKGTMKKMSVIATPTLIRSLSVSPSGNYLLVAGNTGFLLYSISSPTSPERILSRPTTGIKHGVFINDNYFVVQYPDRITRYKINQEQTKKDLINATSTYTLKDPDSIRTDNCNAITMGKNGHIYLSAGHNILEYTDWDMMAKGPANTYELPKTVTCIALDGPCKYLAAGTYNGGIWLKALNRDKEASYNILHRSRINDIKFYAIDAEHIQLATASGDNTVKLSMLDEDKINTEDVITLDYHRGWVNTLTYTPDGKYLLSGGQDKVINTWPTSMKSLYDHLTTKKE